MVARYGACLPELTTRQRRVLRLRAGVGPRPPASRAAVARKLELPVARVRRAEQRGLRSLRRSARDGCASASDGAGVDLGTTTAPAGGAELGVSTVFTGIGSDGDGDGDGDGGSGGGGRALSSSGSGNDAAGGVKGVTAIAQPPEPGETGFVLPLLGVLLVLACVVGFGLETRRLWRSGTAARPDR